MCFTGMCPGHIWRPRGRAAKGRMLWLAAVTAAQANKGCAADCTENASPLTSSNIQSAVAAANACATANPTGLAANCPLDSWDVSGVTNMSYAFKGIKNLKDWNIDSWDVSNVVDMHSMFNSAELTTYIGSWQVSEVKIMSWMFYNTYYNRDIALWNTAKVQFMHDMFRLSTFNRDIDNWDTGKVKRFSGMFKDSDFNRAISAWDVSSATTFESMFKRATSFSRDLDEWDVSSATTVESMFYEATSFNGDVSLWDVSLVTTFESMFYDADAFNGDVSSWDVSSATTVESMFYKATSFNGDLDAWDVSLVTTFKSMFYDADAFNGDVSSWDVSSAHSFYHMFDHADAFNGDLNNWDVSSATTFSYMFYHTAFNGDLDGWDVSSGLFFNGMFAHADAFNSDLSEWDVSSCITFDSTFFSADAFNGDLNGWDVSSAIHVSEMFAYTDTFNGNLSAWDTSSVTTMAKMFKTATAFNNAWIAYWDTSAVNDMRSMFAGATSFNQALFITFTSGAEGEWDTSAVTDMSEMFQGATSFASELPTWDTSAVKDMTSMFRGATSFNQGWGLLHWDVGEVTDMTSMFRGATSFNQPLYVEATGSDPAYGWDTSNVVRMDRMFESATAFNQEIRFHQTNARQLASIDRMFYGATAFDSSFDLDMLGYQVTTMHSVFEGAVSFNQPLHWYVGAVTDMSRMFFGATAFNSVLEDYNFVPFWRIHWDVEAVEDMTSMFEGASAFTGPSSEWGTMGLGVNTNIGDWNPWMVSNMTRMFFGAIAFDLDINKWETGSAEDMSHMFAGASAFSRSLDGWHVSGATAMTSMFDGATSFLGGGLDEWNVASLADTCPVLVGSVVCPFPTWYSPAACSVPDCTTTTTVTTTTVTTTTVLQSCGAGTFLSIAAGVQSCDNCSAGTYSPAHRDTEMQCQAHRACPAGQFKLWEPSAEHDTPCAERSADHCTADEFMIGRMTESAAGTFVLKCTAHAYACPWGSAGPNASHVVDPVALADASVLHAAIAEHLDNHGGHDVYVPVCERKRTCTVFDNEYVHGNDTGVDHNRECRNCPQVCVGQTWVQHPECPAGNASEPAPSGPNALYTECTVPPANNSRFCCRRAYNRSVYKEEAVAGNAACHVGQPWYSSNQSSCARSLSIQPLLSTTTTMTTTMTTTTTTTTVATICGRGQFRDSATNACEGCPAGRFQTEEAHHLTDCIKKSECAPDEMPLVHFESSAATDVRCVSTGECGAGEYAEGRHSDDVAGLSGQWAVSCVHAVDYLGGEDTAAGAAAEADCAGQHYYAGASHTINVTYVNGQYQVSMPYTGNSEWHEAISGLPRLRVCAPHSTCFADRNEYMVEEGTPSADRVCARCPIITPGCTPPAASTLDGGEVHPCNRRVSASGNFSLLPEDGPECTGVYHDNARYCCRLAYDRSSHFWDPYATWGGNGTPANCSVAAELTCFRDAFYDFGGLRAGDPPTTTTTTTVTATTATTATTTTRFPFRPGTAGAAVESETTRGIAIAVFALGVLALGVLFYKQRGDGDKQAYSPPAYTGRALPRSKGGAKRV